MQIKLNGNWTLESDFLKECLSVSVPGSIYQDLLKNHLIEDPFYRENEKKSLECLKYDYTYSCHFYISEEELEKTIELVFLGIDTISQIYVNEKLIFCTYNMHRRYRFSINEFIHGGDNTLKVVIKPAIDYMNQERSKSTYQFMQMGYCIPNYPYIRKAHSMFGWDWGPQLPDGGIWRDVYLEIYQNSRIEDIEVLQNTSKTLSKITVNVSNILKTSSKTKVELYEGEKLIFEDFQDTALKNDFYFEIENPHLWNVRTYGEQNRYQLLVKHLKNNEIIDEKVVNIGLRDVKIIRETDQFGESFTFEVNGVKIFAKGSNYIIEDNILARTNEAKTRYLLEAICQANHNFIRVWGGGIYPPDYFFDLCDELGILVWQDLMFACSYYDMDNKGFVEEITLEIIDNLKRIRNHPSIGLICGNNENEAAIFWNPPNVEITKKMYLFQYEELIPKIVKEVAPQIFYWPSSPSSHGEFDNPNDDSRGDMHYWGVWHNNEPIEFYRKYFSRFLSEYGIQSFPSIKTIKTFTNDEDLNVFSYVMENHQKNNTANEKIINYISKMFRLPKDFDNIIYVSQLIQAEGVRYCVEHLRRNFGRCMGSLYWQLNDCWPGASWSSIDYYGRYKALHYYSRRFYKEVLLSIEENKETQTAKIFLTNELFTPISGRYNWFLTDLYGNFIEQGSSIFNVASQSVMMLKELNFHLTIEELRNSILIVEAIDTNNNTYENHVSFVNDKHLELKKGEIHYNFYNINEECLLELWSDKVMKYVEIDFTDNDFIFSDNYFLLYPNKRKIISWTKKPNQIIDLNKLKIRSLVDSYK